MATLNKVRKGSNHCRDCGGETTFVSGINEVWCLNKAPKVVCKNLSDKDRNHCEHCGRADPGAGLCSGCGRKPL